MRLSSASSLDGEHPTTPQQIIDWQEETAESWNDDSRPSCGAANIKCGGTEHEIYNMLWAAQEPTVADPFAVMARAQKHKP